MDAMPDPAKAWRVLLHVGVIVATVVVAFVLLGWDECSRSANQSETAHQAMRDLSFVLVAVNFALVIKRRTWLTVLLGVLCGLLAAACLIVSTELEHAGRHLQMHVDGVVVARYRSNNHSAPAIDVLSGGERTKLEYVARDFWDAVKVDDRIEKSACGNEAKVNGKVVPIFP